jgi:hypothetical protein
MTIKPKDRSQSSIVDEAEAGRHERSAIDVDRAALRFDFEQISYRR